MVEYSVLWPFSTCKSDKSNNYILTKAVQSFNEFQLYFRVYIGINLRGTSCICYLRAFVTKWIINE